VHKNSKTTKTLIILGVLVALTIGATALWAVVTETWSGDASGAVGDITPLANWEGVIDRVNNVDYFSGTWQCASMTGVFSGIRNSRGGVDNGTWRNNASSIGGTFGGTFVDTGGSSLYDTVAGTWVATYGGSGNGSWWGYRDLP